MGEKIFHFNHAEAMQSAADHAQRTLEQRSGYTVSKTTDITKTDMIEFTRPNGDWGATIFMRRDQAGGGTLKLEYGDNLAALVVEQEARTIGGKSSSDKQNPARVM
jgi:hypothetical protein